MSKFPSSLNNWHVYAGGTSAPSHSHSYDITVNGKKYMIVPEGSRFNSERLMGYRLDVFPSKHHGYATINASGEESYNGQRETLFRRASSAAKAARLHFEKSHTSRDRTKRHLSLAQATDVAHHKGLLDHDYYALHHNQVDEIRSLLEQTRWRQSDSSKAMGRSRLYSFHLAMDRLKGRRTR